MSKDEILKELVEESEKLGLYEATERDAIKFVLANISSGEWFHLKARFALNRAWAHFNIGKNVHEESCMKIVEECMNECEKEIKEG